MGAFQKNQRAGRLIHVHGFRENSNYEYDLNSNRIHGHAGDEEFNAVYDNQDRLIRFKQSVFSYNPNGELLSKSEQLACEKNSKVAKYNTTAFNYDVFGNLKQAGKISYKIDPLQRRSARLNNGVVTNKYIYNPKGQLIGELDANGNLLTTFVYGSKSHVPDYFIDQKNNRFKIITDQLGSLRLVVNSVTGEIKEKMLHDEFGKVTQDSNPNFIPLGFAGGLYDNETKLVRFGARDYDSETGRWTTKDPMKFGGGDSNIYGYVFSDPVNLIDPKGQAAVCTRPINPLPIQIGPIHHEFLCVINADGTISCGGLGPSDISPHGIWNGPGVIEPDSPNSQCKNIGNGCMDKCLGQILKGPAPAYQIIGSNCQDFTKNSINSCTAQCGGQ